MYLWRSRSTPTLDMKLLMAKPYFFLSHPYGQVLEKILTPNWNQYYPQIWSSYHYNDMCTRWNTSCVWIVSKSPYLSCSDTQSSFCICSKHFKGRGRQFAEYIYERKNIFCFLLIQLNISYISLFLVIHNKKRVSSIYLQNVTNQILILIDHCIQTYT